MAEDVLHFDDMPEYIMNHLKYCAPRKKKEFLRPLVILLLRRNQRFSKSVANFESIFKLKLPVHIKKLLMAEKELFDNNEKYNSDRIEQLSVFLVKNSPICEDSMIYAGKMSSAVEIAEKVFS